MLEKIVKYIPPDLRAKLAHCSYISSLYYRLPSKYAAYYQDRLKELKDLHKGQRCFIIGTGPSLNKTNLSLIKDEVIFGVNTLYRGLSKFGITCNYYAVSDPHVWQNHSRNILELDTILLLSDGAGKSYLSNMSYFQKFQKKEPLIIRQLGLMWSAKCFSKDLSVGVYNAPTVIIDICLQAAYYMGFKEVYLLGCDCDYGGSHYDGSISKQRPKWSKISEDWTKVFASYEICKRAYEEDGREIINATVGGKLEIFRRQKLEDII